MQTIIERLKKAVWATHTFVKAVILPEFSVIEYRDSNGELMYRACLLNKGGVYSSSCVWHTFQEALIDGISLTNNTREYRDAAIRLLTK
jgi:hypothetical protein